MSPEITAAFSDGRLVRPDHTQPDLVHLVRALAHLCGSADPSLVTPPVQRFIDAIGVADHYVFILLDGLGMNLVRKLPANAFVVKHLRSELRATCPSTTACALTSVATGEWPARHGVTGWFTYLPDRRFTITMLPFTDRFTHEWIGNRGLKAEDILPVPAMHTKLQYQPLTLLPAPIVNTTYANYSRGGTAGLAYSSIPNAIDQTVAAIAGAGAKSYIHLYIPDIDTRCHHRGIEHPSVMELVTQIDSELARLADALNGRARIVVTADHGLIDVPLSNHMHLPAGDPLLRLLEVPPSGDARLPIFHCREGQCQEFASGFAERFGPSMALLPIDQAERMRLFGPGAMSPVARQRFGDFIGIAVRPATLHYILPPDPIAEPREPYLAQHAGLSPDEVEIPLAVA